MKRILFQMIPRITIDYYKKVYQPNSWHFSLQMILARKKKFLGVITLYRVIGKDNFKYDDIFILDMLKDHMAFRLNRNGPTGFSSGQITVSDAVSKFDLTKREEAILRLF